jgi:hypothetical protein
MGNSLDEKLTKLKWVLVVLMLVVLLWWAACWIDEELMVNWMNKKWLRFQSKKNYPLFL